MVEHCIFPSFVARNEIHGHLYMYKTSRVSLTVRIFLRCFQAIRLLFLFCSFGEMFVTKRSLALSSQVTLVFFAGDLILIFSPILVQTEKCLDAHIEYVAVVVLDPRRRL